MAQSSCQLCGHFWVCKMVNLNIESWLDLFNTLYGCKTTLVYLVKMHTKGPIYYWIWHFMQKSLLIILLSKQFIYSLIGQFFDLLVCFVIWFRLSTFKALSLTLNYIWLCKLPTYPMIFFKFLNVRLFKNAITFC